ncbi:MAG: thiamine pyrophosphate-binding protein [Candidatus Gastranaerophilales bacterium]|nr:thiamine pyrophosphate-binding protein [Candidatus Gastranaerophilales bacterium]
MTDYIVKTETNIEKKTICGAEHIVNILEEHGVDTIFGYPGAPILPLYNALSKTTEIKHYLSRHEQGAIHSAEGYAKVSGKCGVVLVTSGPGFTNTLTGIMNAHSDKTPLVIISGQVENQDSNEFQDTDIISMTKSCTKKTYKVHNSEDIERAFKLAFHNANKAPKGPVVITVTKSALENIVEHKNLFNLRQEIKVEAPHSCVTKTIEILKNAERPLMIVGGGCINAERELIELAHLTHIPLVHTLMGKGIADEISLGMIGSDGKQELNSKIQNSDIVLALGTRFTNRTTNRIKQFLPNSKIISINIEHNKSKNVFVSKEIIGEMNIVLQQMIGTIKAKNILFGIKYDWIESLSDELETEEYTSQNLTSEYVLNEVYKYTKKYRPIITTDVGQHQILSAKVFNTTSSKNFITSGGFGAMGFGLPAAIGAHIAQPNALVMNITGDGSFQMNVQELGTCAEYNIPVKIMIMNNSSLGMVSSLQEKIYNKKYESDMINPDFVKIAQAYGILGYNIRTKEELQKALKEIFTYKKAVLLNIVVDDE